MSIVRYPQLLGTPLERVLAGVLSGSEGARAVHTQALTVGGLPAVQVWFSPPETGRPDTVILAADPEGEWWTMEGMGDLCALHHVVGALRWLPRTAATPSPTLVAEPLNEGLA